MEAEELYPSFGNLIDKPTSIMYRPEDGIVVGMGQLILDNEATLVLSESADTDFVAGLDRLYPLWRREKEQLQIATCKEYAAHIPTVTRSWANQHLASQFHRLKYIPPGYEAQWKENLQKKAPPQKHWINPLCINGKYSMIAIKVKEQDKFRIAFSKIDGTVKGFYRASSLELVYVANACFIGNTNKGFIATAQMLFHFEIKPDLTLAVLWGIDNPTYPKFVSENVTEHLDAMYPEILLFATETMLLVAKFGQSCYAINLAEKEKVSEIKTEATSLYATAEEITCGSAHGQVQTYGYAVKPSGVIKTKLKAKRTRSLCKDWKLHDGTVVSVVTQPVLAHMSFKSHTAVALEKAYILSDWSSSAHAVVNNVEQIVSLALIGDLVVSLSSSYNLFYTQLVQSVPVKRDPLYKDSPAPPRGRQLLYADPTMVCVLAVNGDIVQTVLGK